MSAKVNMFSANFSVISALLFCLFVPASAGCYNNKGVGFAGLGGEFLNQYKEFCQPYVNIGYSDGDEVMKKKSDLNKWPNTC